MSVGLSFVLHAQAQPAPPAATLQRVEVTGSNLKQIEGETASPVIVRDRADIERSGANSVKEFLESLFPIAGVQSDTGGRGTYSAGSSGAGLRNMGLQATLVLLNSRRAAPYPLAEYSAIFTNIDSLPLSAVERIEILPSGASAIYGSDAMAGVINIITRNDFQGVQVKASHQHSLTSHTFATNTASITAGIGDLGNDRYNVLTNVEVFHRDGVVWRDVLQYVNPVASSQFPGFSSFSTYSYPGNVIGAGPVPGCAPELLIGGLCRYDRYQRFEAIPAADRVNLLTSAKLQLGDGLLGFAELLHSNTKTTYIWPYLPYGSGLGTSLWPDPTTGQIKTFTYRGLPASHPLNPTGKDDAEFRYRFVDVPAETNAQASQYRLLAGLRGTWDRFEWESAAGAMGGRADQRERGSFSDSGFKSVIGDYTPGQTDPSFFNRDYKIGQANSAAVLDKLFPVYGYRGSTDQVFIDAKVTGEVTRIEGRPVALAAGADLRHERFKVDPSANLRAGDIVGNGLSVSDAARTYGAIFGELSVPVTQALELQAAGRIDKFPSFGAHFSPKLGMRFEVSKALLLRGTVEGGFRTPNLSESAPATKFAFDSGHADPKRCTQAQALSKDLLAAAAALPTSDPQKVLLQARADNVNNAECSGSVATIVSSNPGLQPETSRSAGLGFVLEPTQGTTVSVDYWNIERKNEIGQKDPRELLSLEDGQAPGVVNRAALDPDRTFTAVERAKYGVTAGSLVSIVSQFQNLARTKTSGIDIGISGRTATPLGRLDVKLLGSHLISFYNWSAVRNAYGDNLAGNIPRLRTQLSGTLSSGPLTNALTWNYTSATRLNGDYYDSKYTIQGCAVNKGWTPGQCRFGSIDTLDYYLAYSGVKDLTLSLNIRNLMGRRPPVNLRGFLEGGKALIPQDVSDVMGRMLRLTLEYRFL